MYPGGKRYVFSDAGKHSKTSRKDGPLRRDRFKNPVSSVLSHNPLR